MRYLPARATCFFMLYSASTLSGVLMLSCKPQPVDPAFLKKNDEHTRAKSIELLREKYLKVLSELGLTGERVLLLQLALDGYSIPAESSLQSVAAAWVRIVSERLSKVGELQIQVVQVSATLGLNLLLEVKGCSALEGIEFEAMPSLLFMVKELGEGWKNAKVSLQEIFQGYSLLLTKAKVLFENVSPDEILKQAQPLVMDLIASMLKPEHEELVKEQAKAIGNALMGNSTAARELAVVLKDHLKNPESKSELSPLDPPYILLDTNEGKVLRCKVIGLAASFEFVWQRDGVALENQNRDMLAIDEAKNAAYRCGARKKDLGGDYLYSFEYQHGGVFLGYDLVTLTPIDPVVGSVLKCSAAAASSSETGVWEYRWYRNSILVENESSESLSAALSLNEIWHCEARLKDSGRAYSRSGKVRVLRAPPKIDTQVGIDPSYVSPLSAVSCSADLSKVTSPQGDKAIARLGLSIDGHDSTANSLSTSSNNFRFAPFELFPNQRINCSVKAMAEGLQSVKESVSVVVKQPVVTSSLAGWSFTSKVYGSYIVSAAGIAGFEFRELSNSGELGISHQQSSDGFDVRDFDFYGSRVVALSADGKAKFFQLDQNNSARFEDWIFEEKAIVDVTGSEFDLAAQGANFIALADRLKKRLIFLDEGQLASPVVLSSLISTSAFLGLAAKNNDLFAIKADALNFYDASDPAAPILQTSVALNHAKAMSLSGSMLYVLDDAELKSFDVSVSGNPAPKGVFHFGLQTPKKLHCQADRCYVLMNDSTLEVVSFSNVLVPALNYSFSLSGESVALLEISADRLFVSLGTAGNIVISATNGQAVQRREAMADAQFVFARSENKFLVFDSHSIAQVGIQKVSSKDPLAGTSAPKELSALTIERRTPVNGTIQAAAVGELGILVARSEGGLERRSSADHGLLNSYSLPGVFLSLQLQDDKLIAARSGHGIELYNFSDPAAPSLMSSLDLGSEVVHVVALEIEDTAPSDASNVMHALAQTASGAVVLVRFDLTQSGSVSSTEIVRAVVSGIRDMVAQGDFFYVAYGGGLKVYQLGDDVVGFKERLSLPNSQLMPAAASLAVFGKQLYVASGESQLTLVDVSSPGQARVDSRFPGLSSYSMFKKIFLAGSQLFSSDLGLSILE